MSTIRELYLSALKQLDKLVATNDLRLLLLELQHFANYAELDINQNKQFDDEDSFWAAFKRLNKGEPVQYIVNNANFFGHDYYVDQRVLIPRPETEELVDYALKDIENKFKNRSVVIADIGTGSGVIAIECAKKLKNAVLYATDIDERALEVARKNANTHQQQIIFHSGNMLDPLIEKHIKVDVIISNPPYIKPSAAVDIHVRDYEPNIALFAKHGIDYYQEIINKSTEVKRDTLYMYFEIGEDQEADLSEFIQKFYPNIKFKFKRDLQGKTRFLFIET